MTDDDFSTTLTQPSLGAVNLAVCVAQPLCERDPAYRVLLEQCAETALARLQSQQKTEAAEMVAQFGQALFGWRVPPGSKS
jgi:hypothetical protein